MKVGDSPSKWDAERGQEAAKVTQAKTKEASKAAEPSKEEERPKTPSGKSPEKTAYHRTIEVGAKVNAIFAEINLITGTMKGKKRELKELEKKRN